MKLTPRRLAFLYRVLRVGVGAPPRGDDNMQPSGPEDSYQARDGIGLKGNAKFTMSADGTPQFAADQEGGAATIGDARFGKLSRIFGRDGLGLADLGILAMRYFVATAGSVAVNLLQIGAASSLSDLFGAVLVWGRYYSGFQAGPGATNQLASVYAIGPGQYASAPNQRFINVGPNLLLSNSGRISETMTDPFKDGVVLGLIERMATAPTAAPDAGFFLRARASNDHPEVLLPGDDPSTGWRDLLAPAVEGKQSVAITTSSLSSPTVIDLGNGRIVELTGTGTDTALIHITPQPATDAESQRFTIVNKARSVGGIVVNNDGTTGGISTPGNADYVGDMNSTPDGVGGITVTSAGAVAGWVV